MKRRAVARWPRWVSCKPGFFLPVRVLSRLFRRLFLEKLRAEHHAGNLNFFAEHQVLAEPSAFADWLQPLRQREWVVYAKRPFVGPEAVLAYLARYTHRVAIANSRLMALDEQGVTFQWKDYRCKGRVRYKTMTLTVEEFMRRFLLHVLPAGLHRIRHYGLLANTTRKNNLTRARELLTGSTPQAAVQAQKNDADGAHEAEPGTSLAWLCPDCGAPMIIIETFQRGHLPRAPPGPIDAL